MAVTITKRFWNDSEYKSVAKIVFTSPNFTSPTTAGTRSHMQPGGKYMGTWFEAVDFMYRKFNNQNYISSEEMEGFFGRVYVSQDFNFDSDSTISLYHTYGSDYQFTNDMIVNSVNFVDLGQTSRDWRDIAAAPNGNIYACVESGDIYKQSAGTGDFVALVQTSLNWRSLTVAPNGDVYATVYGGSIYKQTAGTGTFTSLGTTVSPVKNWNGITAAPNGDIYATVYGEYIYKRTSGTGNFTSLGATVSPARNWNGINVAPNGNVYACVGGTGDIYKQTGGTGNFIALGQTARDWWDITSSPDGDIYACVAYGDIYKQIGGTGTFTALNQTSRYWRGITCAPNNDIYACTNSYIYKKDNPSTNANILYKDKDNYGVISEQYVTNSGTSISGIGDNVVAVDLTFSSVVGSGIINEWYVSSVSGSADSTISGMSPGTGNIITFDVETVISGVANNSVDSQLSGIVSGSVSGMVIGLDTVSGTVTGTLSGTLTNDEEELYSDVSGVFNGSFSGTDYTVLYGTVSGTISGSLTGPYDQMYHQYSNVSINSNTIIPKKRRVHGGNSIIFSVTFGEAYDCKLTAWDDNTHSTTNNKILYEEHYRVDASVFRSSTDNSAHSPTFRTHKNLVFPPCYDMVLKGNEKYYGSFDLIFSIDPDEYGEYLVFTPRLVDIDDSFLAGSYDFITTLHYQYT